MARQRINRNTNLIDTLNNFYAHTMVHLQAEARLEMYRKLAALLRNRFSLMDALERLYQIASKDGKNPSDTMALAISSWMVEIRNGSTFSEALRGWAPSTELLLLSVGDVSNLEIALQNTVRVVEGMNKMRQLVWGAVAYPVFLLCMVSVLIWAVAKFMVPPMTEAVPGLIWRGVAATLVDVSNFVDQHPILLFSVFPCIVIVCLVSFPYWTGIGRAAADRMPPWSIYRTFIGVSWLLSLSALVRAGMPVSRAVRSLMGDEATPYLRNRLSRTLLFINNGDNLGEALYHTHLGFPDEEVIGDLRIYAELDSFQEALENLANSWLDSSIRDIEKNANILNGFAIMAIAVVIGWVVWATFDMQNQMVSGMGLGGG